MEQLSAQGRGASGLGGRQGAAQRCAHNPFELSGGEPRVWTPQERSETFPVPPAPARSLGGKTPRGPLFLIGPESPAPVPTATNLLALSCCAGLGCFLVPQAWAPQAAWSPLPENGLALGTRTQGLRPGDPD